MALILDRYPIDFRSEIVHPIMAEIQHSGSVSIVGLAGAGKSNLVHFMGQPEVLAHYLPHSEATRTHVLSVQCRPGTQPKEELFGKMLSALLQAFELAPETPLAESTFNQLRSTLASLCGRRGQRLVFVFDEFESLISAQGADFFEDLRELRDEHRTSGNLLYVVITHRMPQRIPGSPSFEESKFFEILRNNIFPLGPYRKVDARGMLHVLLQRQGVQAISPAASDRLIAFSGGHAGLLRAVVEELSPNFERSAPRLLTLVSESQRIRHAGEHIWTHLHIQEQRALSSLVFGQAIPPAMQQFLFKRGLLDEADSSSLSSLLLREYILKYRTG